MPTERKENYGVERGNMGIKINNINDPTTRFSIWLLGCKLMLKCRKEEVLTSIVETAM
jgi:hypothetical protein